MHPIDLRGSLTLPGYNVRKAAQVVAFFAQQEGGRINVLKLSKLVYLADRESMGRYDRPMLFDKLVSMDHGPVSSLTLNHINGLSEDLTGAWGQFVADRTDYTVGIAHDGVTTEALDQLSEAELEVLVETWERFGHLTKYELRDETHRICPEWEDPHGTSFPIPYERVFKFLGKTDSGWLAERIDAIRYVGRVFDEAR